MRQIFVSLAVLLYAGTAGDAQDNSGLAGVYGPGQTAQPAPAAVGGIYGPGQSAPAAPPPPATSSSAPEDTTQPPEMLVPGPPLPGRALPIGSNPLPLSDRPGYGTMIVNGHTAIVERGTNRIIQLLN
jgi:hypothetical protein